jgi:alkanesulfonate monooxygenase SsuD/methylene tetrahydromethanopterin reductase-like flavin-dependent oxidoreductase (luciferase family)
MKFGVFYEQQVPRPWEDGREHEVIQHALAEVEHADRLGIDYAWAMEHHFLEEYSHSSAPEVFLAAAAARTKRIRLGHGVVLTPASFNHPARVAERIATLDLVSGGRVEFGTGESASRVELEGFGVDPKQKKDMWQESTTQICRMLTETPYPGFEGRYFRMPARNVVPKPMQKPHPPLWLACSNRESIRRAAQLGMGALTFTFLTPAEAKEWVDEYYATFKRDCEPIGQAVNPNITMVTGFACHETPGEAQKRAAEGFDFFAFGLGHYYVFGEHTPGETDVWARFKRGAGPSHGTFNLNNREGLGTPDEVRRYLRGFAEAGVDQVGFLQQCGRNRHEDILESLDLFARKVLPEFHEAEEKRLARKAEELAPYIEKALAKRKVYERGEIPAVEAYARARLKAAAVE